MKKHYIYIIIGAILILAPINTLLSQVETFLDKDGHTEIRYIIDEGFDISEVASVVSLKTRIDEKKIDVEIADDGYLFIELPFVETDIMENIINNLDGKYSDSIEFRESLIFDPTEFTGAFYLIIAMLFISVILGVVLVVKGLIRFSKKTKT